MTLARARSLIGEIVLAQIDRAPSVVRGLRFDLTAGREVLVLVDPITTTLAKRRGSTMPPNPLPLWIQYVQILGLPAAAFIVTLVGAWIALQQMRIANNRLKYDLYDKRSKVFDGAQTLLRDVMVTRSVTLEQIKEYHLATAPSSFILDDDLTRYLGKIGEQVIFIAVLEEAIGEEPAGAPRDDLEVRRNASLSWIEEQPAALRDKFIPFLQLREPRPSGRLLSLLKGRFTGSETRGA